jgi:hypothetical protein
MYSMPYKLNYGSVCQIFRSILNLDKFEILADESIGNEPEKNHDSGAASIKQPVGGVAANRDERVARMLPSLLSPTVRLPHNVP